MSKPQKPTGDETALANELAKLRPQPMTGDEITALANELAAIGKHDEFFEHFALALESIEGSREHRASVVQRILDAILRMSPDEFDSLRGGAEPSEPSSDGSACARRKAS